MIIRLFTIVLIASGLILSASAQTIFSFRLAEVHPLDYPIAATDKEFAKIVEIRSKGRIKIACSFGGALGQEKAVIADVQAGKIDFARVSLSPVAEQVKELNALLFPYLYSSHEQMWKVLNGPIGEELLKKLENAGMIGLAYYEAGSRNFYTKKPVTKPSDLRGMKIRVQENRLMMGLVTALGATPVPMGVGDVYSALQSGYIDGAENNIPSYVSFSHYEVATNYILDGHTMVPEILIASSIALEKLSKSEMDIIRKAAKDVISFQKQKWTDREKRDLARATEAGCAVIKPDPATLTEFHKAVAPVYDEFGKDYKDLIAKIKATK
jgi:tripartite ATP-independent transporter DctP family solute receptor